METLEEAYNWHDKKIDWEEAQYETGITRTMAAHEQAKEAIKDEMEFRGVMATPDPQEEFMGPVAVNPPKPRKKRNKAGNMIKEPVRSTSNASWATRRW